VTAAPTSGGYFEWVIRLTRGELLDLVLEVEERLRRLVRTVFSEARTDWEKLIPESIRSGLEQVTSSATAGAGDLLDRADLGQLIGIVLARWPRFASMLGDKQTFRVKAQEFREWRNSLAHGKEPSADEKVEIAVVVRQVGQQIPILDTPKPQKLSQALTGSKVLWVDDHPEWNLRERQLFRTLGIDVVPVLSNDEAVHAVNLRQFELIISDIDRGGEEGGNVLPSRLHAVGVGIPLIFYIGSVDPSRDVPAGAASLTDDPAILVRDALNVLSKPE
jgi:CheY-like chemotaxis protein